MSTCGVDENPFDCGCTIDTTSSLAADVSCELLRECGLLDRWGVTISGHMQQGVTTNSRNPTNPPVGSGNMPATLYNYRNDEYILNQMLLRVTRKTDNGGCGWDIGGHMDLLYGTDYVFLQSLGLETEHDFSNRWNSSNGSGIDGNGLMGLALPQLYLEVAYDDLTFTVVYKLWDDAALFGAVYDNQWVVQLGAQYSRGRYRLRAGCVWAENPIDNTPGANIGGVVQDLPGVRYTQGLLAITSQHRISFGVGVVDVLPGIDLDLMAGGMFRDTQQLGQFTTTSIESYWVGARLTWRFGRGACCETSAPDCWSAGL